MARSAETAAQHLRRQKIRQADRKQGQDRPYFGFVQAYTADSETVLVDSHGGRRVMFSPQPHLGQSAWMRAAPEGGMGSLMITRSDSEEPEVMRWWHTDTAQRLSLYRKSVEALAKGSGQLSSDEAFRPLESGEIDLQSRGGAALYMGSRPHLDMRAGVIRLIMDQDEAEFATKAPLHIRRGHKNAENEIVDEERFGSVRRMLAGSFVDRYFPDDKGNVGSKENGFAKEWLIRLSNGQNTAPATLFDHRSGNVIDDEGKPFTLDVTGLNLRSRSEYFTPADTTVLAQLDENGNFKIEHPQEATYGGLFVLPAGTMRARIGVDFTREIGRNETADIGVDKIQTIGNNDMKTVGVDRTLDVGNNEMRNIAVNSTETVGGNKTIKVNGTLVIQTGSGSSRLGFTDKTSAFETDVLSVLAKEIIFEAPLMTFNGAVNITGALNVGGTIAGGPITAPNLGKEHYNGSKGSGSAPAKSAIRTPGI